MVAHLGGDAGAARSAAARAAETKEDRLHAVFLGKGRSSASQLRVLGREGRQRDLPRLSTYAATRLRST